METTKSEAVINTAMLCMETMAMIQSEADGAMISYQAETAMISSSDMTTVMCCMAEMVTI